MRLIVGLGNPGRKYAKTRHNLGFMVIDELARRWNIAVDTRRFHGWFAAGRVDQSRIGLLKPDTFMNRSGQAVVAAANFYKVSAADVLVVLDDLALPVGQIRIRTKGSGGGHKGLIDILNMLGTNEVPRLRIGIGLPPEMVDPVEFVLTEFLPEEIPQIKEAIARAADAVERIQAEGYERAMDLYN